jgi:predicted nucleic acid-binding protein
MVSRSLVLDANILIRAVLGKKVTGLLTTYSTAMSMVAPLYAYAEAERNLPTILAKRGAEVGPNVLTALDDLRSLVTPLDESDYAPWRDEALARIKRRDPDDWPILATALAIDCPIWTEDRDFFGTGVATWTTDRVELFFRNTAPSPGSD